MLRKLDIGPRLLVLIVIQAVTLVAIGAASITGLHLAGRSTEQLNRNVSEGAQLDRMAETIREDLLASVREVRDGRLAWAEARGRLASAQRGLDRDWAAFVAALTPDEREFTDDVLAPELEDVRRAFAVLGQVLEAQDEAALEDFVIRQSERLVEPFLNAVLASSAERELASARTFERSLERNARFFQASIAVVVLGVMIAGVLGVLIYRSISGPIRVIAGTVESLAAGDYDVRSGMEPGDELGNLGAALDHLLEDKVTTLARAKAENEHLNDSIIRLLEAVDELGRRNLTLSIPVSADVTGPLSDAINKMSEEFGRVLAQVAKVATAVGGASAAVNKRAIAINTVAHVQRQEVERTARRLATASRALEQIAATARECSARAEHTTASTDAAVEAVQGTLCGMHEIRESIQQTERRIKRLGDRSQEITGVVDIINTIAERTHMLALNASMQAASAGEAGRGFGVVADEVQRLAESSREATRRISALVRNIQIDTNDTIVNMDKTIGQVVEGSRLAEAAENRMALSRETTAALVGSVELIATRSTEQSQLSTELRDRSDAIVARTTATTRSLANQLRLTKTLVQYSEVLNRAVRVFRLPGGAGVRRAA